MKRRRSLLMKRRKKLRTGWDCRRDPSCSCLGVPPDLDKGALFLSEFSCGTTAWGGPCTARRGSTAGRCPRPCARRRWRLRRRRRRRRRCRRGVSRRPRTGERCGSHRAMFPLWAAAWALQAAIATEAIGRMRRHPPGQRPKLLLIPQMHVTEEHITSNKTLLRRL